MWLLVQLSLYLQCCFSLSLASGPQYRLRYGNVVTTTKPEKKVSDQLLEEIAFKLLASKNDIKVIDYEEEVQYYSNDGIEPTTLHYMDQQKCYGITVSMGTVHSLVAVLSGTRHQFKVIEEEDGALKCKTLGPFIPFGSVGESCSVGIRCPPESTSRFNWSTVTIATYNIWNVNSTEKEHHSKRIKRLAKVMSKFDIIGLQEVRSVSGLGSKEVYVNQIEMLGKALPGYQYVYQPAMLFTPAKRDEEGVAIMSRFPIVSTEYILLPWNRSDPSDFHQRICLHAAVVLPSGIVMNVFVTHLSLSGQAQIRSVVEIYRYMDRFFGPLVLLGDLNSEPGSIPLRFLTGKLLVYGIQTSGIDDVWSLLESEGGETFCALGDKPDKQDIDSICVQSVHIIGKESKVPLSDHFGLSAELKLTKE